MAHPCFNCQSECYCNGSWDDCIVEYTPKNCESCGCASDYDDGEDFECCDNCDLPDACYDFGCAVEQNLKSEDEF